MGEEKDMGPQHILKIEMSVFAEALPYTVWDN